MAAPGLPSNLLQPVTAGYIFNTYPGDPGTQGGWVSYPPKYGVDYKAGRIIGHNGEIEGGSGECRLREDGTAMVILFNGEGAEGSFPTPDSVAELPPGAPTFLDADYLFSLVALGDLPTDDLFPVADPGWKP